MTAPSQAGIQSPVYVQLTEPARTFFVANWEARQLVDDFTNSLHYLDSTRNLLILTLIAFNPADHRQYIDDHRDQLRAHVMAASNVSAEEADQLLDNSVTFSKLILQDSENAPKVLGCNLQVLLRILLTRAYGAFYLYASELVSLVYETRLAHLVILDVELGRLLSKSVREHIAGLTRAGQKDRLYGEFKDRLGVPFFDNATDRNRERVIAELRHDIHDIEHNQARISARLVRNVQHCSAYRTADIGNPIILDANQVVTDLAFFQRLVSDADEQAAAKFQLPRVVFYLPADMANQGQPT